MAARPAGTERAPAAPVKVAGLLEVRDAEPLAAPDEERVTVETVPFL